MHNSPPRNGKGIENQCSLFKEESLSAVCNLTEGALLGIHNVLKASLVVLQGYLKASWCLLWSKKKSLVLTERLGEQPVISDEYCSIVQFSGGASWFKGTVLDRVVESWELCSSWLCKNLVSSYYTLLKITAWVNKFSLRLKEVTGLQ